METDVIVQFVVGDVVNQPAMLGLENCVKLNLLNRVNGVNTKQFIEQNARPHIEVTRRVPYGLMERLKDKLDELEAKQAIRKLKKPNTDISLCLDPKYLILVMKQEHFVIPTAEYIAARMGGNSFFTVLNLKDG
ncbi:hypothetical protein PR048_028569 [Dryococelus australis]|uniref:Uncharacterized protein n=1 Tax=Dryococelus australis TaxID=614101 RepID=A0ABQ9GDL1_9NEOP|nr:hypothetical protein PR048_028569 [Dryococelus australis]